MEYPEHEKLTAIQENSQLLGEFLEWARSSGHDFCIRVVIEKDTPWERVEYQPCQKPIDGILAEFYGIDLKKLETEKCQMLESIHSK